MRDLNSHVDSIESNLKQVDGVVEAIQRTKAAVQTVLLNNLDHAQYEELLLG